MMLRLIVESVMLLKDDDWREGEEGCVRERGTMHRYAARVERGFRVCGAARAHPVDFGHFVSPSAALVSAHQLRRGALFSGAAESETVTGDSGQTGEFADIVKDKRP